SIGKMSSFLSNRDDPMAIKCCEFLINMAEEGQSTFTRYGKESEVLLSQNILRCNCVNRLEYSSPVMRRMVLNLLFECPIRSSEFLSEIIQSERGYLLDIPELVKQIVPAMNPLDISCAPRQESNMASPARRPFLLAPGPKVESYVRQFTSALLQLTSQD